MPPNVSIHTVSKNHLWGYKLSILFSLIRPPPKIKTQPKISRNLSSFIFHQNLCINYSAGALLQHNTLHQYQYGQCKVGDHSWILLRVRGQYSQQHSTHCSCYLTAALHTLTTLLQGVLHCIPSNQCDQWMRTLHCFHQLSTSTFHVIWWQLQQQQHHSHHRDFLNLDVRTQRTATWRPSHQMIHHIDPTQSQCHDQADVLWLVSTWIPNSHTYNFDK